MKVVRSASHTGRIYPQEMFLVLIFTRGLSRPQDHGKVGRNMSLKNPVTPTGIDPGTVRLVAQRLNHYATPGPHLSEGTEENYWETSDMTVPFWAEI
jgi:hypothetical protein